MTLKRIWKYKRGRSSGVHWCLGKRIFFPKNPHFLKLKTLLAEFVGNKAKMRISKRVLQENKARQIFRKTNISNFLSLVWWEMFVFRKLWPALFSCNTHFEICPFALLSMSLYSRSYPDSKMWNSGKMYFFVYLCLLLQNHSVAFTETYMKSIMNFPAGEHFGC